MRDDADKGLEQLIRKLARLPGMGPRSARRAALHLLKNRDQLMLPLAQDMADVARAYRPCVTCGNLDQTDQCHICTDGRRDASRLCVVEDVADLWAMERAAIFLGRYHILGGTLSAIDGRGPQELGIDRLLTRAAELGDEGEIVLATSATVDGQTTAHYLAERMAHLQVKITRLAHGVPVGGELNYLDDGTLAQAMKARTLL